MPLPIDATWFKYLDKCQQTLVATSFALIDKKATLTNINDYSFVVFPIAKAYEGFLKKIFFDLSLITKDAYEGRKFRIGRALNPDVRDYQRDEDWLFDNVEAQFGTALARQLWDTWLTCRNRVFHYFSDCDHFLGFDEALSKIQTIVDAMQAVAEQLDTKGNHDEEL